MLSNLFQKNIFVITIAILYFNNLLQWAWGQLLFYYGQYASVYGYADFLHVQIMERVDIYNKYSFKKQK